MSFDFTEWVLRIFENLAFFNTLFVQKLSISRRIACLLVASCKTVYVILLIFKKEKWLDNHCIFTHEPWIANYKAIYAMLLMLLKKTNCVATPTYVRMNI